MRVNLSDLLRGGRTTSLFKGPALPGFLAEMAGPAQAAGRVLGAPDLGWSEPVIELRGLGMPLLAESVAEKPAAGAEAVDGRRAARPGAPPRVAPEPPGSAGAPTAIGARPALPGFQPQRTAAGEQAAAGAHRAPAEAVTAVLERLAGGAASVSGSQAVKPSLSPLAPKGSEPGPVGLGLLATLADSWGAHSAASNRSQAAPSDSRKTGVGSEPVPTFQQPDAAGLAAPTPAPERRSPPPVGPGETYPGPDVTSPGPVSLAPQTAGVQAVPLPGEPVQTGKPLPRQEVQLSVQVALPRPGAEETAEMDQLSRRIKAILVAEARRHGIDL